MARVAVAAIVVLTLVPAAVSADHILGIVGLYGDAAGTDCTVPDAGPGMVELHIVASGVPSNVRVSVTPFTAWMFRSMV